MEKLREEFVFAAKQNNQSISSLCREFEISRKTGYKWLKRSEQGRTLSDESRKPHKISNKTPDETANEIIALRHEHPAWGARKIACILSKKEDSLPCIRTVNNILKRNGLIDDEEALKRKACHRFEKEYCNEMWQADFKGDFSLLDGSRCFPLTILDDHSRFSIKIDAKSDTKGVKNSFRQAFLTYGMPNSILTDNGAQFSGFKGGYTQFERWLMDHDIVPIHGRIMHPQTQGKIERFHRSMKQELLKNIQFANLSDADRGLQDWRRCYNEFRPHEALNMKCPAEVYIESSREYYEQPNVFEYEGLYHICKVNNWGYLRFDKWQIYLSETFADTRLEIRPNPHGDYLWVYYRNFVIACVDPSEGKLLNRKIFRC